MKCNADSYDYSTERRTHGHFLKYVLRRVKSDDLFNQLKAVALMILR